MRKQNHRLQRSRYLLLGVLLVSSVATFMILWIGTVYLNTKMNHTSLANLETNKTYDGYYALVVQDTTDSFWQSVYESAKEEGEQDHIYVELIGAELQKHYSLADKFRMALASGVDGIMIGAEGEDIEALLNEAEQADIPVITLLSDSIKGERKSFVGINSGEIGSLYCKEIEMMKEAGRTAQKAMILIDAQEQMNNKNMMYLSIKDQLEAMGVSVEVKPIDRQNVFNAEETIRNIVLSPKKMPDVLICLTMSDTLCAYQSVIDYNKVGKMEILGYDRSETILEGISKGIIDGTLFINSKQMGEQGVQALYHYEKEQQVNAYSSVDVCMIHKSNLADFTDVNKKGD